MGVARGVIRVDHAREQGRKSKFAKKLGRDSQDG